MNPTQMTDAQRIARVKEVVLQASDDVRRKYPILKHQDAIGATIMVVSLLGMIGSGLLYVEGIIPWWLCVPVTAIFASFIHELEHDLIHSMYFRQKPWVNNLMLAVGWLARASTISPLFAASCTCTTTSFPAQNRILKSVASPTARSGAFAASS